MKKNLTGAIIVAAGKGKRTKAPIPKQYLKFGQKTILGKNIENFINQSLIHFVLVVIDKDHTDFYQDVIEKINSTKLLPRCFGGKTRSESVKNGLMAIKNIGCTKILIQDGARPFTSSDLIKKCINGLDSFDVVFPGIQIPDTLYKKQIIKNNVTIRALGPDRDTLIRAQTPQAFHFDYIYQRYASRDQDYTDDVTLAFLDKKNIDIVDGSEYNFKITTPEDVQIAEKLFLNV
jgi:2-C-methyl-D-erythritol 4-phosphate cytidylyltransferase